MVDDRTGDDWGPFGRPIFDDAANRKLSRVGVLDVGSNSVRLVIFDGAARSPAYFYNEKIMCALGAGLSETSHLNPEGRKRAVAAIKRFQKIAQSINLPEITAVATAAVRAAKDGPDFCAEILRETGLKIWVIDGQEEARLSAQGVLLGWPGSYGLVCDIGGSSMELAEIADGRVGRRVTSDLGPLKLREVKGGRKGRRAVIEETLDRLQREMGEQSNRLFLVGGSWRAFARIDMHRRGYPLHVLHEYRMSSRSVTKTRDYIKQWDLEELRSECGISSARISLVPYAAEVLVQLVRRFKPKNIAISAYGIREGMLYEQMPGALRDRDPLIEACRWAEAKDARIPGFGRRLYKFIYPIFRNQPQSRLRLIKAACLLHDVSWRAHPDYRAEVCFDNATRASLGGLGHDERVFLGTSLLHRYRNKREGTRFEDLLELLGEKDIHAAEIVGRAMRFGAMLWNDPDSEAAELQWRPKKRELILRLSPETYPLFGEVVAARFQSLAASLDAETKVVITPAVGRR